MARRIKVESTQTAEDEAIDMAIAQLDERDPGVYADEPLPPPVAEKRQPPSPYVFGSAPEVVEVTWGQELFSPVKFTTITVGPFSAKGEVLRGETAEQAYERLYARVRAFAERERERKLTSFIAAAKTVMDRG